MMHVATQRLPHLFIYFFQNIPHHDPFYQNKLPVFYKTREELESVNVWMRFTVDCKTVRIFAYLSTQRVSSQTKGLERG